MNKRLISGLVVLLMVFTFAIAPVADVLAETVNFGDVERVRVIEESVGLDYDGVDTYEDFYGEWTLTEDAGTHTLTDPDQDSYTSGDFIGVYDDGDGGELTVEVAGDSVEKAEGLASYLVDEVTSGFFSILLIVIPLIVAIALFFLVYRLIMRRM